MLIITTNIVWKDAFSKMIHKPTGSRCHIWDHVQWIEREKELRWWTALEGARWCFEVKKRKKTTPLIVTIFEWDIQNLSVMALGKGYRSQSSGRRAAAKRVPKSVCLFWWQNKENSQRHPASRKAADTRFFRGRGFPRLWDRMGGFWKMMMILFSFWEDPTLKIQVSHFFTFWSISRRPSSKKWSWDFRFSS